MRGVDPPPAPRSVQSPDIPDTDSRWTKIQQQLRPLAGGRDGDDLLQEAMLRLLKWFGLNAPIEDARRLGTRIIRCLRVDASRKLQPRPSPRVDECADRITEPNVRGASASAPEAVVPDAQLALLLGSESLTLLIAIVDGLRETKVLARRMGTSPCSVRRRRKRIVQVLRWWLQHRGDPG